MSVSWTIQYSTVGQRGTRQVPVTNYIGSFATKEAAETYLNQTLALPDAARVVPLRLVEPTL